MDRRNQPRNGTAGSSKNDDGAQIYVSKSRGNGTAMAAGYADEEILDEEEEVYEEIVADEGRDLLAHLIVNEMSKETSAEVATRVQEQVRQREFKAVHRLVFTPSAPPGLRTSTELVQQEQIVNALARIGDALEADRELNSLIVRVPPEATWETFQKVAKVLFADGVNWGRIVALFFFACKMVRRSLDSIPMISHILDWASRIIKLYLAHWIVRRGGWRGVMEWFGPSWSQIGMTFGAVLCAYCVAWRIKYA